VHIARRMMLRRYMCIGVGVVGERACRMADGASALFCERSSSRWEGSWREAPLRFAFDEDVRVPHHLYFRVLHATRICVCYHLSLTHMAVDCRHCLSFASRVPCASITTTTTHPRVLFDEFASRLHLSFACRVRRGYASHPQLEFACNLRLQ